MPSTATPRNRLEKQEPGENSNTWGSRLNSNMIDLVDVALDGVELLTVSGSVELTVNDFAADQARKRVLNCTGAGGTIVIPNVEKSYLVRNGTSGALTVRTGTPAASAVLASGSSGWLFCDGSESVYLAEPVHLSSLSVAGALTVGGGLSASGSFSSSAGFAGNGTSLRVREATERCTDPSFNSPVSWTGAASGYLVTGGNLIMTGVANPGSINIPVGTIINNQRYLATVTVASYTEGSLRIRLKTGAIQDFNITGAGTYSVELNAGSGSADLLFGSGVSSTLTVSDIAIRRYDTLQEVVARIQALGG
ncbi:hypothetical protein [Sphingosinicella terrae]|uniref:hypothetical protein n=1 Tax=Sphingosinicella terrae TaxID=2172047 RepID=UPI0013B4617D|nr:hypothetical protein [Sphingosinicella terrae]